MKRTALAIFPVLLLLLGWCPAVAHSSAQSYIFLRVFEDHIECHLEFTLSDLQVLLERDLPLDGSLKPDQLQELRPELIALVESNLDLSTEGQRYTPEMLELKLVNHTDVAQFAVLKFLLTGPPPETLDISNSLLDRLPSGHTFMVVIMDNWSTGTFNNEALVSLVFTKNRQKQTLELGGTSSMKGFAGMVWLGVEHIILGFDHILFLMALLLPAVVRRKEDSDEWEPVQSFRESGWNVFKIVTVFTLAHSVTLSLAALKIASVPSRWVESLIAASVAVAAVDILRPVFRTRLWLVVFIFGLFHGFGFAAILGELAIPEKHLLLSLLGFNLGVELGQIAIVVWAIPVLFSLRKTRFYLKFVLRGAPAALIVIALYWFTERAFGIDLPLGRWLHQLTGFMI